MANEKLLTTSVAAKRLKIHETLVRRWCAQGRFGEKIGDRWLITEAELKQFMGVRRKAGRPAGEN